jgi:predicted nucleic acid-binding protein
LILVDTGPLVALFDPRDGSHLAAKGTLAALSGPLVTTIPVLTEAFHLLDPSSQGAQSLRRFILQRGLGLWWMTERSLHRAFRLMDDYADHPMDLTDASLVAAAEFLRTTKVFTIDRGDFRTYRARIGRTLRSFTIL